MKISYKLFLSFILMLCSSAVFADNALTGIELYKAKKYEQAMTHLMTPDAQKNPAAQNLIGYLYDKGLGVEKNAEIANQWYLKAAEQGFAKAQFNLGLSYEKGTGISKNMVEAVKWYRKAAEQNHAKAEMKMGYLTVEGIGTQKNYKEALQWYRRAAEHGDNRAYADIGLFYDQGNGVKKDPNRAVQYYIMGAEKGDGEAQLFLADCYAKQAGFLMMPIAPCIGTRNPPKTEISLR